MPNQPLTIFADHAVVLTEELARLVPAKVQSGRYENANEVERAALDAKLDGLRTAIVEGDASGIAEGDVFARVRAAIHLLAPR